MTCIAWDGKTLAADKQSTNCGYASTVTKIARVPGGLVAFSGSASHASALLEWFRGGRDREMWPKPYCPDEAADVLYIDPQTVCKYNGNAGPYPEHIEDEFTAMGSGRDYALAAMHMGKSAREAVEVACALDINCGCGIDTLGLIE